MNRFVRFLVKRLKKVPSPKATSFGICSLLKLKGFSSVENFPSPKATKKGCPNGQNHRSTCEAKVKSHKSVQIIQIIPNNNDTKGIFIRTEKSLRLDDLHSRKNKLHGKKGRHFAGLFPYEHKNRFFVRHPKRAFHHSQMVVRQNRVFSLGSYPILT